jgi:DNA mismatch endonuclease, patch repair protein
MLSPICSMSFRKRDPAQSKVVRPSEQVSARMRAVKQRDNSSERALRSILHRQGLRFRIHYKIAKEVLARPDIAFVGAKVAVFLDGCFWHRCPTHGTVPKTNRKWWISKLNANVRRDRATDAKLRLLGWRVLRIWEHEGATAAADCVAKIVVKRSTFFKRRAVRVVSHGLEGVR